MKGKKGAFTNTSTGYGKSRHSFKHNSNNHNHNNNQENESHNKSNKVLKGTLNDDKKKANDALERDKDLNSGFGDYLKSPEAVEMMKLFVFANTIMLILTKAWPNVKEMYYMLMNLIHSD